MSASTTPQIGSGSSEIFDSLPYYDNDLEQYPHLKQKVEQELAREAGTTPQELHPKVPPPFELFSSNPLLKAELDRCEAHEPLPQLDTVRYQLPGPVNSPASDEDWRKAIGNAHAQLEHQRIRQANLALLQQYGSNAWRIHNYRLESAANTAEKVLEELKNMTTEVNRDRKNIQTRFGSQLTSLETRWTELISSVLQIEMANAALEADINQLNKKEAELAAL
ncbi:breast carcinoma amplified sequence 2 [Heliocybe sulcata]|uniref:Breast carcinoma amplified sequence 2 n=1 Tax=Heliocybe sulcata TaxID=5364 RepID=A0A5C3NHS4_9AGAM|nr:breast carcinoma amplified sequence 2 [Heliocybe sulcata]